MSPRRSFVRKIGYLVVIALLLLPLFLLSNPASPNRPESGGYLAQLREKADLNETQLGQIDASGETMKLATLGMRGVAAVFLWQKAHDYQMRKDWTNLSATLTQLTKLEPHFVSVWRHQAWNLAYNVSAEFDDYHDRYRWVIRGIEFMQSGIPYNRREPRMPYEVAFFISEKIGRSDETKQFRLLFREDGEFNGALPKIERDNWLVGKRWYGEAEKLIEQGAILRGVMPVVFYSKRPMCQMDYAEALEKDGIFQERALLAWKQAGKEWHDFGASSVQAADTGAAISLNDLDPLEQEAAQAQAELLLLDPELQAKLVANKRALLTPQEREALDTPPEKRTPEQIGPAALAADKTQVSNAEFARHLSTAKQKMAQTLVERIDRAESKAYSLHRARDIVNFDYWRRRAEFEQEPTTLAAREAIYNGDQAFERADLIAARDAYNQGWAEWQKLFDQAPDLSRDILLGEELLGMYQRYRVILEKCDERVPENFAFAAILESFAKRQAETQATQEALSQIKGM